MKRERPTSVLVLAILQIVFGSLCFLLTTCGGAFQLASANKMFKPPPGQGALKEDPEEKLEKLMEQKVPVYKSIQVAQLGLGLVLSVALVVSGIGLLKLRPWARTLALAYAVISILETICSIVYELLFAMPVLREFVAGERARPGLKAEEKMVFDMMEIVGNFAVFAPLIILIFPIVVLIILLRPNVRAAFSDLPRDPVPGEADDYADEGWPRGNEP
jgi:hypothetical protein